MGNPKMHDTMGITMDSGETVNKKDIKIKKKKSN